MFLSRIFLLKSMFPETVPVNYPIQKSSSRFDSRKLAIQKTKRTVLHIMLSSYDLISNRTLKDFFRAVIL